MGQYTVGQYLVDRLHQIGIEHLFAIPGDYCAEWINDYVEPSPIERVGATNELNAGYAADGYARQKGVGAVCVTYSVGAFSLLNAVAGSYTERVPVVVLNGAPSAAKRLEFRDTGMQWHHLIDDQSTDLRIFREVTVVAERLSDPSLAPGQIDNALRACLTERLPVYLEMNEDIYGLPCEPPQGTIAAGPRRSDPDALKQALDLIAARLRKAERPLLWAGVELERFGLATPLSALIGQLGIPYVTSLSGKGVLSEDHPHFLGVFNGPSTPDPVARIVESADYVLALGVWLTDENLLGYELDWGGLTLAARDVVRTGTATQAQVTLADLLEGLQRVGDIGAVPSPDRPARASASDQPSDDQPLTYQGFYDAIAPYVDESTLVMGGTGFNFFGSEALRIKRQSGYVSQSTYADIGYVTPAAIGASLGAEPGARALVFAGDGGFQMTAQCIGTMAELGIDPVIFLLDNGVYGIEQWLADPEVYATDEPFYKLAVLHRWDYAKLAESLGGRGWKAETYGQLGQAVKEALAHTDGPSLIQVRVPEKSVPELAEWKVREAGDS